MRHRIALLLVGSLSSHALRACPAAPRCGAAVAGTGPALQAGGWEDFQSRPGGSTPLGPFTPHGLSRCRAYVEREVDERIQRYTREENPRVRRLLAVLGAIPFATAEGPKEEQIAQRLSYFMQQREHQQQIKRAIKDLKRANEGLGTGW